MTAAGVWLVALLFLATGCVGRSPRTPPPAATSSPVRSAIETEVSPGPGPVLYADLSEAPATWQLVMSVPFGAEDAALGFQDDPNVTALPDFPPSFTVAPDGTFWILDPLKHRVAHYTGSGTHLGAVGGLRYDRFHPRPRDVVIANDTVHVLHYRRTRTSILAAMPDGPSPLVPLRDDEQPVLVHNLLAVNDDLICFVSGYSLVEEHPEQLGSGPVGFAVLETPESGVVEMLPGVPVAEDRWIVPEFGENGEIRIRHTKAESQAEQELDIELIPGAGNDEPLGAIVGGVVQATLEGQIGLYVGASPAEADAARSYGDGHWYLQLGATGEPLIWERLPEGEVSDELQLRHLAAGPDGSVYLMLAQHDGMEIYRRP
jgi:hypothetical protein